MVLAMGVLDSKSLEDHIRASQPGLFSVPTREALLGYDRSEMSDVLCLPTGVQTTSGNL